MSYEQQYHEVLKRIIDNRSQVYSDRTGVGVIKSFGESLKIELAAYGNRNIGNFPALEARKINIKHGFYELLWMLSGRVDVGYLQERNIKIWNAHSSAEFLKSSGKEHIEPNTIGKGYGYQFRNFNGVDQLANVIDGLTNDPFSRRHIISLWNPSEFDNMALPPCHMTYHFTVEATENVKNKLHLHQYIRSNDWILGQPTNSVFAAFFLFFMAKITGMDVGTIHVTIPDAHVYCNHFEAAKRILEVGKSGLVSKSGVAVEIKKPISNLQDVLELTWEDDVIVYDYNPVLTLTRDELPIAI